MARANIGWSLAGICAAAFFLQAARAEEDGDIWGSSGAVSLGREKEPPKPVDEKRIEVKELEEKKAAVEKTETGASLETSARAPLPSGGELTLKLSAAPLDLPVAEPQAPAEGAPIVEWAGSVLGVVQGTSGVADDTSTGVGRLDIKLKAKWDSGTKFRLNLRSGGGDGPDANCPSFSGLNANASSTQAPDGADRVILKKACVTMLRGGLSVAVGKIDTTAFVNANTFADDEQTQFLSDAFTNNISLILPREGYTPGVCVVHSSGAWTITLVGASDDNSGERLFDEIVGVTEVGFTYGSVGGTGNIRFHAAVDGAGEDAVGDHAYDFGWGLSFDQELGRKLGLFVRWGRRETDAVDAEVESSWSAGLDIHAFSGARPEDVIGLAYGHVTPAGGGTTEKLFEVYYRAPISEKAAVSAHVQVLSDALGDPDAETATVFGVRTQMVF